MYYRGFEDKYTFVLFITFAFSLISQNFSLDYQVYLGDEEKLEEYVINDKGRIFTNTYKHPYGAPLLCISSS